jgi:hypothetical protein
MAKISLQGTNMNFGPQNQFRCVTSIDQEFNIDEKIHAVIGERYKKALRAQNLNCRKFYMNQD